MKTRRYIDRLALIVQTRISKLASTLSFAGDTVKVNFIVCGAQKSGTSALAEHLRSHPQVCMATEKELHFFDDDQKFKCGRPSYGEYHSSFKPAIGNQLFGEATPSYMYWRCGAKRIWEYNPDMKLIVVLRNPIERAYSHWNMQRLRGAEPLGFLEAINNEQARMKAQLPSQDRNVSYLDRGFYLEQLRELWRFFPEANVLVLKNEELREQHNSCLMRISEFLGIPQFVEMPNINVHSKPYRSKMTTEERARLRYIYEFEIRGLERRLQWDCSAWLE